jgi:hypothetical protein
MPEHLFLACIRRVSLPPYPVSLIRALANVRLLDDSLCSDETLATQLSDRLKDLVHQRSYAAPLHAFKDGNGGPILHLCLSFRCTLPCSFRSTRGSRTRTICAWQRR